MITYYHIDTTLSSRKNFIFLQHEMIYMCIVFVACDPYPPWYRVYGIGRKVYRYYVRSASLYYVIKQRSRNYATHITLWLSYTI